MSEMGSLSGCILENDPETLGRARRLRGKQARSPPWRRQRQAYCVVSGSSVVLLRFVWFNTGFFCRLGILKFVMSGFAGPAPENDR